MCQKLHSCGIGDEDPIEREFCAGSFLSKDLLSGRLVKQSCSQSAWRAGRLDSKAAHRPCLMMTTGMTCPSSWQVRRASPSPMTMDPRCLTQPAFPMHCAPCPFPCCRKRVGALLNREALLRPGACWPRLRSARHGASRERPGTRATVLALCQASRIPVRVLI